MRTLVSTLLVGTCLIAGPALAQQQPQAPRGAQDSASSTRVPAPSTPPAGVHGISAMP
jgi:hypothetical protein